MQGEVEILLVASCFRNQDKLWPDEPLGLYADFTFTLASNVNVNVSILALNIVKTRELGLLFGSLTIV